MIKLLKYLKPFGTAIVGIFVLVFIQSIADLYLPTLMADIVNKGMIPGNTHYIWRLGGIMLVIAGGGAVAAITSSFLSSKVAMAYSRNLRSKVFSRVQSYSLNEFDKIGTASLITRTTNDINQVQTVLIMVLRMMVSAPMMGIGGIIMAISMNRRLTMILAIALLILVVFIAIVGQRVMPLFKFIQSKLDKLNLVSRENLTGIRVIRAFNRIDDEKRRFDEANLDLTNTTIKANKIMAGMLPIVTLIMNLTGVAIIWFGSRYIDLGDLQIGDMMAFLQYAIQIMMALLMLSMMFVFIPRGEASAVRINEVLDMAPEINDPVNPKKLGDRKGYIEFRDVSFSYPGAEKPAIHNITFSATPGEVTAIIGGTGSGKSTLINLIPRFYDVDKGAVLINGVDVREIPQEILRKKIGFVPQKALLFTGSIIENIKFGKEDATEEEVKQAAEIAQASEFISGMEDGFDSEIAQGGANVSGGQKQRLSIARALIRRAEVYIFDDSFSALDFKTDAKLRTALKKEIKNATVIMVAQRVSTVMEADRIIVLDQGEIAGIGNHKELLSTCNVYREIVASQLTEEELA
ncbi:ABC-type multidrug transport system, ATpase and permease component [Clostridium aceticum]|uniref:ABC-type multidrug transport system, ATpase and permease component n=1 Tax=Clostridium aceticum TaxID=84022 RepID=A0A0D8I8T8_9CLOT|nr:ABC transporter ATP-binding protein [Clostridium aceticum]AKL96286.1 ABC-type multidrug transport system, ATpase and permease component [Clostridium aceticum]KJF26683.1 multidrug ABC transporter ATP-binding protein [Clostridium aceticum]